MIANHRSTIPGVQADSSVVRSCPGSHDQHGDRALEHPASGAGTGLGEVGTWRATASRGNVPASSPRGRRPSQVAG
jgi:hypothetical protein